VPVLLELLKLPEYRTRYRARRALRGKDPEMVQSEVNKWVAGLDPDSKTFDHDLLEALWVSWGINKTSQQLVKLNLESQDFRARAAAVRALRYNGHRIPNQIDLLKRAAADENARVRLESIVTASWLDTRDGVAILDIAKEHTNEAWMAAYYSNARFNLTGEIERSGSTEESLPKHLKGEVIEQYKLGKSIYMQDGYCWTCHQEDGKGLIATNIPPLAGSDWVLEDEERLVKITLKGLSGQIRVNGKRYLGNVPMMGFEKLLNDDELAAVLTYVRNSFGNKAAPVSTSTVSQIRKEIEDKKDHYTEQSLSKD
jgi:mono/diheme cytochrome c family protein